MTAKIKINLGDYLGIGVRTDGPFGANSGRFCDRYTTVGAGLAIGSLAG